MRGERHTLRDGEAPRAAARRRLTARARFAGGYGHDYVAKLLSVAGDDAPPQQPALYYPHLQGDDQGSVCGWRWRKRSAEAAGGPREECYVPRRAEREYVPGV